MLVSNTLPATATRSDWSFAYLPTCDPADPADGTLTITDDLTLDKFKDKRIVEGDEIRARWEKDGKNTSKSFKKTAGC